MEGAGDDHQSLSGNTSTKNNGSSSSSSSGSRWNPTKEQINMLESFYRQGLRTPSAEQIQQITARLRAYGHIEGKNVFYWFQNHKARQRQKQKQEINLAYVNRFLNPVLPPPAFAPFPHAVCPPYYTPPSKNDLSFYHHHYPKVQPPAAATMTVDHFNRTSPSTQAERYNKAIMHHHPKAKIDDHRHASPVQKQTNGHHHHHHQETLELFPIHPTGVLNKKINPSLEGYGNENTSCYCYDEEGSADQLGDQNDARYPFIDFFCRK